jgi:hypothetical protein
MRILLFVYFSGLLFGQSPKLPPDIDPQSNSRLPLIQRDQLSDDEKKIFDDVANTAPGRVSMFSPPLAEPIRTLNSRLRATVLGSQMFEICALIAAREFDEDFEWTGHDAGAKRAGVSCLRGTRCNGSAIRFPSPPLGIVSWLGKKRS